MGNRLERAHVLMVEIQADTKDDLMTQLRRLEYLVATDQLSAGVSGGPGSGTIYAYRHDDSMTHERYFELLQNLLDKERREGAG